MCLIVITSLVMSSSINNDSDLLLPMNGAGTDSSFDVYGSNQSTSRSLPGSSSLVNTSNQSERRGSYEDTGGSRTSLMAGVVDGGVGDGRGGGVGGGGVSGGGTASARMSPSYNKMAMAPTSSLKDIRRRMMGGFSDIPIPVMPVPIAPPPPNRKVKLYNRAVALPPVSKGQSTRARLQPEKRVTVDEALESEGRLRVSAYCSATALNLTGLVEDLRGMNPKLLDCALYCQCVDKISGTLCDIFYFEYGVVVCWGLSEYKEREVMDHVRRYELNRLTDYEQEVDRFAFSYSGSNEEDGCIVNDVIFLHRDSDYTTKLAISHALSQSTKLCVFEERIDGTIEDTKYLPAVLASTGSVPLSRSEIGKKIGHLFMQKCAVNLLTDVLDVPEYFWGAPDGLQNLYDAARQYMEITMRVDVLNTRVQVLQDLLTMLKDTQNDRHSERLELIVIWLIVIEVFLGIIAIIVDYFVFEK